jgi:hypothetical protein
VGFFSEEFGYIFDKKMDAVFVGEKLFLSSGSLIILFF